LSSALELARLLWPIMRCSHDSATRCKRQITVIL